MKIVVAVVHLHGEKTIITAGPSGKKQIVSLSLWRIVWSVFVQACRMAVAVSLGIGGTQFLVGEISLKDMLLNTAALAFVMDLDELIHETFVPKMLQDLVGSFEELTIIRSKESSLLHRFIRAPVGAVSRFVAAVLLLATVMVFSIIPQRDVLYDAGNALCGGELNFVYGLDKVDNMVWTHTTPPATPR